MPNTKSAERRMRSSARKNLHNRGVKSRLKTLERRYVDLASKGQRSEAETALRGIVSALDKAAKGGVIPKGTADRKKSRLSTRLAKVPAGK